ncbi:hypothetical protein ACOSQ2_010322 [Xanthoceras sorbifolium]
MARRLVEKVMILHSIDLLQHNFAAKSSLLLAGRHAGMNFRQGTKSVGYGYNLEEWNEEEAGCCVVNILACLHENDSKLMFS